jgi:hypothetical protein
MSAAAAAQPAWLVGSIAIDRGLADAASSRTQGCRICALITLWPQSSSLRKTWGSVGGKGRCTVNAAPAGQATHVGDTPHAALQGPLHPKCPSGWQSIHAAFMEKVPLAAHLLQD